MSRFVVPRRYRKLLGIGAATVFAALLLSGCSLTGGGWMFSTQGSPNKATFSFNITCVNFLLTGGWVYHDKASGIDAEGTVPANSLCLPDGAPGGTFDQTGTYTAQHCKSNCTGNVHFVVTDSNQGGKPLKGDHLSIAFTSGPLSGYSNNADVQGGNLFVTLNGP